jgi:DNA-binding transcriptional ArsR family regulator
MSYITEDGEEGQKIYRTLVIKPNKLSVLNTELAVKILQELAKRPSCAMDIARRLKEHEQKIYYHLRRLEKVGIIKIERTEERSGALAKIFSVSSPFVSVKLFDSDHLIDAKTRPKEIEFFKPFIHKGKLDATIVVGSPDPHGKYSSRGFDGSAAIDLGLFLGTFLVHTSPDYRLDTEIKDSDLKNNLIIVGGPKANILIDKINDNLPVYFDTKHDFNIISTFTKSVYSDDHIGIVVKMKNPFAKGKEILVLSGKRFDGTRAAILALIKYLKKLEIGNKFDSGIARIVEGIDKDSDGRIDDVEFLE